VLRDVKARQIFFRHSYPISKSIIFESVYPAGLTFNLKEKRELFKYNQPIKVYMFREYKCIGEIYAFTIANMKEDLETDPLPGFDKFLKGHKLVKETTVYVFSFTVLPKYQGEGYGKILYAYFMGYLKGCNIKAITGHAHDRSLKIVKDFGAKIIEEQPDWYGTGESYYLYLQRI
jgi:ribosomal protein S18 acetylase RimI-like enzyme